MDISYEKALRTLQPVNPDPAFVEATVVRLEAYQTRQHNKRLVTFSVLTIASFGAMIPSFMYAVAGFTRTGFYEYFQLVFTDSTVVFSNWQIFAKSLTETFPVVEVLLFSSILVLFVFAVRTMISTIQTRPTQLPKAAFA